MRIVYVANHDSGDNDDEGGITHALRTLGHDVEPVRESIGSAAYRVRGDFLLFHKWQDYSAMRRVKIPKVFWYFDLVDFPDPTVTGRCRARMEWMRQTLPSITLGLCTDGDWVKRDKSSKLVRLTQGADIRVVGKGTALNYNLAILFVGSKRGSQKRTDFVDTMLARYHHDFHYVERGAHGRNLANLIATAQIVVAPDSPITDDYWSNRVYLMLGYGAFLLHPYCKTLADHYKDGEEIVFYHTRQDLFDKIDHYRNHPADRERIANAGLARTLAEHTYTKRCETLIQMVKERL